MKICPYARFAFATEYLAIGNLYCKNKRDKRRRLYTAYTVLQIPREHRVIKVPYADLANSKTVFIRVYTRCYKTKEESFMAGNSSRLNRETVRENDIKVL